MASLGSYRGIASSSGNVGGALTSILRSYTRFVLGIDTFLTSAKLFFAPFTSYRITFG